MPRLGQASRLRGFDSQKGDLIHVFLNRGLKPMSWTLLSFGRSFQHKISRAKQTRTRTVRR
jgi:hypothetical protein